MNKPERLVEPFPMEVGEMHEWVLPVISARRARLAAMIMGDYNPVHQQVLDSLPDIAIMLDGYLPKWISDEGPIIVGGAHLIGLISGKFIERLGIAIVQRIEDPLDFGRPILTGERGLHLRIELLKLLSVARKNLHIARYRVVVWSEIESAKPIIDVHARVVRPFMVRVEG